MLVVLSPSKRLDYKSKMPNVVTTDIRFPNEAEMLSEVLKQYQPEELAQFMSISKDLADLNTERNLKWKWPFEKGEARPSIFAFKGDVYDGLDATNLKTKEIDYAQKSLRILSGLYGVLRPLDEIMPYRLEMGSLLVTKEGTNLYEVWKERITAVLNEDLKDARFDILLNLASQEYFKAVNTSHIEADIITPVFKDFKNGTYKVISFYAKKARGLMTRFVIENRLKKVEDLKAFDYGGYHFNAELSAGKELVFTRN